MEEVAGASLAGRYLIVRELGRGAFGEVFEVLDESLGARVALKRLRSFSPEGLRALKGEFRHLAGIAHPNLVRLYDLVVTEDAAFFTMELVEGRPVLEHAVGRGESEMRRLFVQLASALCALHARRKLHRDIKSSNVLVTHQGSVRVLDFGMAVVRQRANPAGTLSYMAPELFAGSGPSEAADWYAFGILLYSALTGVQPFNGLLLPEAVLAKQRRRLPRVRELVGGTSPELDDYVWALLDPDPDARPTRWDEARPAIRGGEPTGNELLTGREQALAQLESHFRDACDETRSVLLIEGESGVGKTTTMAAFVRALGDRAIVFQAAARSEEHVPLRAMDGVVDRIAELIQALQPAERAELGEGLSEALARRFPVLAGLLPLQSASAPGVDPIEARREAHASLLELVRRLVGDRPALIWVDDLQWSDRESVELLKTMVDERPARRLAVFLARRPEALPWPELEVWVTSHPSLKLEPLEDAAALRLLDEIAPSTSLEAGGSRRILDAARGNPFLLGLFASHAARAGDEQPLTIERVLSAVLSRLRPDARLIFDCLVLSEQPLKFAWFSAELLEPTRLRELIAELGSERLISLTPDGFAAPYHDRLRERGRHLLDEFTLKSRHASLCAALDRGEAPPEARILHLEGAGRYDEAGRLSVLAAERAATRYAFQVAGEYYQQALRLRSWADAERARLLECAADNLALAGRNRLAADLYAKAGTLAGPASATPRASLAHRRAIALLRSGELGAGRNALRDALCEVGERLPRSNAESIASFVWSRTLLRVSNGSVSPERVLSPELMRSLEALWTAATSLSMYEPLAANALVARFVRRALATGNHRYVLRAWSLEAAFLAALGTRYRARAGELVRSLEQCLAAGVPDYERAWITATLGSTAWLAGDVRACRDFTASAREIFALANETSAYEYALIDAWRIPAYSVVGDFQSAAACATDTLESAEARGDAFAALPCRHGHITGTYLALGDVERAARGSALARELVTDHYSLLPAYHQLWSCVMIELYACRGRAAYAATRSEWPKLRRVGLPLFEVVAGDVRYLRALAALGAAREAGHGSRRELLVDVAAQSRWLRRSTLLNGVARALSLEAQSADLAGGRPDAMLVAEAARVAFDGLGVAPERDAFARWLSGEAAHPEDRLVVPALVGA